MDVLAIVEEGESTIQQLGAENAHPSRKQHLPGCNAGNLLTRVVSIQRTRHTPVAVENRVVAGDALTGTSVDPQWVRVGNTRSAVRRSEVQADDGAVLPQ